jgi:hypothetical protein
MPKIDPPKLKILKLVPASNGRLKSFEPLTVSDPEIAKRLPTLLREALKEKRGSPNAAGLYRVNGAVELLAQFGTPDEAQRFAWTCGAGEYVIFPWEEEFNPWTHHHQN